MLVSALEQLEANRRLVDWAVSRGVELVQVIPLYVVDFLETYFKEAGIYTELLSVPLKKWDCLCRRIYSVEMDRLLVVEFSVHEVYVRQFSIGIADDG